MKYLRQIWQLEHELERWYAAYNNEGNGDKANTLAAVVRHLQRASGMLDQWG